MSVSGHEKPNKGATDNWYTPINIIRALGDFDLDPCGKQYHRTARTIYEVRGLQSNWFGRVWLNPPYSEVEQWLEKLVSHGRGIALVFARLDTKWAQRIVPQATEVFLPKGRLRFLTENLECRGNAGGPSMFLAFGETVNWGNVSEGIAFCPREIKQVAQEVSE